MDTEHTVLRLSDFEHTYMYKMRDTHRKKNNKAKTSDLISFACLWVGEVQKKFPRDEQFFW